MQIHVLPIILIMSTVAIGGLTLFTYLQVGESDERVSLVEYVNFQRNLHQGVEEVYSRRPGSEQTEFLTVPKGVERICFVVQDETFNPYAHPELYSQAKGSEENVFFLPSSYGSFGLNNLVLEENPLCVNITQKTLPIRLENVRGEVKIGVQTPQAGECSIVRFVDEDALNIVFMGYNYESTDEFFSDVSSYEETLFSVEPFSDHKEDFNVYARPVLFDNCFFRGNIQCDESLLVQSATKCPNDYIFLLAKRGISTDKLVPIQSSALPKIGLAKINTADNPLVVVHEFGHTFGGLADEYVDERYSFYDLSADDFPNCDVRPCESWNDLTLECIPGCSASSFFRSSDNSLMNDFRRRGGDAFGEVNEKHLINLLEVEE